MNTIKCQNFRPKKDAQRSECGRVISQAKDLTDKCYSVYCAGCKCFIEISCKDGEIWQKPLDKHDMVFDNVIRCKQSGYQVMGV